MRVHVHASPTNLARQSMSDTLEHRAARVLQQAKELGLLFNPSEAPAWHALIHAEIVGVLSEARERCINIQDRIRIGELMLGMLPNRNQERRESPRGLDPISEAIADLPPGGGGTIRCPICGGDAERKRGCPGCNGAGICTVSQAMPEGHAGTLALKSCGCAVDWVGEGIDPKFLAERRAIWDDHGYQTEAAPWTDELRERLTAGAGCTHGKEAA